MPARLKDLMNGTESISVKRAIFVGHLCVTGGVFIVIGVTILVCHVFALLNFPGAAGLGALIAWPWWSITVPKWRKWALERGADAEQLQKVGVRSGLVWPKGCILEKTEI